MIGLLDLSETDRQTLLRLVDGRLVWFEKPPASWQRIGELSGYSTAPVWAWLTPDRDRPEAIPAPSQVASVYRLQHAGLVAQTRPNTVTGLTRAGARVVAALQADGWQPFDHLAPAAVGKLTAVKRAPRPRKRRAS
jgi:hypothetical protein